MEQGLLGQRVVYNLPSGRPAESAGEGSLELLDSREVSVHKYCENGEKQRTGQQERGKSSGMKQFSSRTKPFTHTHGKNKYTLLIIQEVNSQTTTKLSLTSSIMRKNLVL